MAATMLGYQGQTREHATHVPSTGSLVPALLSYDPFRRDDVASQLGGFLGDARARGTDCW